MKSAATLWQQIDGASEDARFAAWTELYYATDAEGGPREIARMLADGDPTRKVRFARFLAYLEEERAIQYVVHLLGDANLVVVEAAKRAFERNFYSAKAKALVPALTARMQAAQHFAIERLAMSGDLTMVDPLVAMLPDADEARLLLLLSGFRYLPDKRFVWWLAPYLRDPREEVRFRTVLVFGALYEARLLWSNHAVVQALADPAPRIRRAVLWALRRRRLRGNIHWFVTHSTTDPDPAVRQEALTGLAVFPHRRIIHHLLQRTIVETDRWTRLKAEGVLLSFPIRPLLHGLRRALTSADMPLRTKALLLTARLQQGEEQFSKRVRREYQRARTDQMRLVYLEAMGFLEDRAAIPLLEAALHDTGLVAYTAMTAVLRICRREGIPPYPQYLRDPQLPPLLKQMVLKVILQRRESSVVTPALMACLIDLLSHQNLNLRYLAVQILLFVETEEVAAPLFHALIRETDPETRTFLEHQFGRLLGRHPEWLVGLFQQHATDAAGRKALLTLCHGAGESAGECLMLLRCLLTPPLQLFQSDDRAALLALMVHFAMQKKIELRNLFTILETVPGHEQLLTILLPKLAEQPVLGREVPLDRLMTWFTTADPAGQQAAIALFGRSGELQAVRFLTAIGCDPAWRVHHPQVAMAFQQLLRGDT